MESLKKRDLVSGTVHRLHRNSQTTKASKRGREKRLKGGTKLWGM